MTRSDDLPPRQIPFLLRAPEPWLALARKGRQGLVRRFMTLMQKEEVEVQSHGGKMIKKYIYSWTYLQVIYRNTQSQIVCAFVQVCKLRALSL